MDQKKIGDFLKELRKERGLTQEQLAEQFHISGRSVSRWETGNNMPDLSILVELAEFYDVDLREIIDGERKSEKMNEELKETVLKVADYADAEKEALLKRVRIISVIGCIAMITGIGLQFWSLDNPTMVNPLVSMITGMLFGAALGTIICMVLYTTGVLTKIRAIEKGKRIATKIALAAAIFVVLTLMVVLIETFG